MDGLSRRAFCAFAAAAAGASAGCATLGGGPDRWPFADDGTRGDGETLVTTQPELEVAFEDLSPGETIRIGDENAPYRTTRWLDVDVDGVSVIGPGVRDLIEPADGAAVGGIRVGHNSRCRGVDVRGIGYRGNAEGIDEGDDRLHGIAVRNAANVTISECLIRGTVPVRHGDGGSGVSVTKECSDVRVVGTQIEEFGDRGIQLAGERHIVYGNVIRNGLDRTIACDVWYPDGEHQTARSASIFGNVLGNSFEGSLVGVARNASSESGGNDQSETRAITVAGNVGFGSHKSFCHVRGPDPIGNISVKNNVSHQDTENLLTEENTKYAGVAVDVESGRNVTITDNELYGYSGHGVHVDSDIRSVTIKHNGIFDPGLAGIRVVDASDALVDGNFITGAQEAGIRLREATNVSVSNNYVSEVGTAGIVTGGSSSPAGHLLGDNYLTATNRQSETSFPAILVRDGGVRVRGNTIRRHDGPAIVETEGEVGNSYAANWADGDDPWQFVRPTSRAADNVPPTDTHRGASAGPGEDVVRVEFDRAYARRPKLSFGRTAGGIRDVSYRTDDGGNFVGADVVVRNGDAFVDVFVEGA